MQNEFDNNNLFKEDILESVKEYFTLRKYNPNNSELNIAAQYVLEELAAFSAIAKDTEYQIDVYPGNWPVMRNIFEKKYNSENLRHVRNIAYKHNEIK
jgi:tRNA-dependent cyclodipeptide synthase